MLSRKSTTLFSVLCLLALVFCGEGQARADSLVIESGFIQGTPNTGIEYFNVNFNGGGFHFVGTNENIIAQRGGARFDQTITGTANFSFGSTLVITATRGSEVYYVNNQSFLSIVTPAINVGGPTPEGTILNLVVPFSLSGTLRLSLDRPQNAPTFIYDASGQGFATITLRSVSNVGYTVDRLRYDFAPAPVPEPASLMLLGGGLAALGSYASARRRRKAGAQDS